MVDGGMEEGGMEEGGIDEVVVEDGGREDERADEGGGIEDGVEIGQTKLGETTLETVSTAVVDASEYVVVDGTSTKVPVKPSGTAQEVVKTGTVMVPTMTLVALTIQVACSVELEQSVTTVVSVDVVGVMGDGGFEDGGMEDGVEVGQTKLGETPLETVISAVVDASE